MDKCFLIAKRELNAFFTTWMGYIIIAAALFIDGLLFNSFAVSKSAKLSADVLYDFFYFSSGLAIVAGVFLAMRLMAEEKQSKTIVLLYTSPISERQVIYGKFLSAALFSLVLHVISLYMPALIFVSGKVSLGHLASGYMCLFLIGATAIAISLFASTICPNQLVAGVTGAALTVTMLVIWMVADIVDAPFREILGYLAIHNNHFTPFAKGIVHSKDIIYYFSVIIFFLECSVRSLQTRRLQG